MTDVVEIADIQHYRDFIRTFANRTDVPDPEAHARQILKVIDRRLADRNFLALAVEGDDEVAKEAQVARIEKYRKDKASLEAVLRVAGAGEGSVN